MCQNLINTQRAGGVLKLTALTLRDVVRCKPTAWMNYKQRSWSQCCCYPGLLAKVVKCALKREPDPIWCPLSPEAGDVQMAHSLSLSCSIPLSFPPFLPSLSISFPKMSQAVERVCTNRIYPYCPHYTSSES